MPDPKLIHGFPKELLPKTVFKEIPEAQSTTIESKVLHLTASLLADEAEGMDVYPVTYDGQSGFTVCLWYSELEKFYVGYLLQNSSSEIANVFSVIAHRLNGQSGS